MARSPNTSAPRADGGTRSRGAAYQDSVNQEKTKRAKAKSLRPLAKLWPFVARYPFQLGLFVVFLCLSAVASLMLPAIVRVIVDCGFGDNPEMLEYCQRVPIEGERTLESYFGIAVIFGVLFAIFGSLRFFFITRLGQRVIADIRIAVFDRLSVLSPSYFERVRTGEVLSRLTTDTTVIETVITGSISFALRSIAQIIGSIILMFVVSLKLAAMVLGLVPLVILPLIFAGRYIRKFSRQAQDRLADASARGGEAISAIQTVQAYSQENKERRLFAGSINASYAAQRRRILLQTGLTFLLFALIITGIVLILRYGAQMVAQGEMTSGSITAFTFYALLVVAGMASLPETITNLMRAAGAADRLVEILNEDPDIAPPENPVTPIKFEGHVSFDDVHFAYPTRPDLPALRGVSFDVAPGETVALVGPSGAGKSTVFQLLLRFYDNQSGRVSIDGHAVDQYDPEVLRKSMAVVQQNTPLFSGTAAQNIGYSLDTEDMAAITHAAQAAYADGFIAALPEGYQTDLGERGTTLSGGQKQRIAIARAILRDAPILLLDEATSALDSESEKAVQAAFEAMSAGRTTLVIAHRLSTVLKADRILVLEDGQIVETGTHAQLMQEDGLYARLAKIQFDQSAGLEA